jgi:enoyl-CoA hydratase/carnithine racemase
VTESTLEQRGPLFILNLGDSENRFTFDSIDRLVSLLDEVDAAPGDKALVTVATGKFWSNGLDLDWMTANQISLADLVVRVQELFARVLEAAYPTVAVIQGHCYAAGGMLALAHDARFMREDRGFMCFPEVNIGMVFTPGMDALLRARLSPQAAHQAMVLGRRFTAPEAVAVGMVDVALAESELQDAALEYAASLVGKDPAIIGAIKKQLYGSTLELLRAAP